MTGLDDLAGLPFAGMPEFGSGPGGASGQPAGSGIDQALVRQWQDAEARVYRLVLSSAERYELSVTLVRAVADALADVPDDEELVRRYDDWRAVVQQVARERGVPADALDQEAVAGAAFSLRHAELVSSRARAAAIARVGQARAEGLAWATLYESGTAPADDLPSMAYHVVQGCLHSPWGVHASAVFDVDTNEMVYLVEPVAVDVDEASWWAADQAPVAERTCADLAAWRAAQDEMRTQLAAAG